MTLEEFCEKYHYSKNTLKRSFNRTVEAMRNKGFILTRQGSWNEGNYEVVEDKSLIPKKEIVLQTRLIGQRFGHLTIIEDTGKRLHRSVVWKCRCDCGNEHEVTSNNLNGGQVNSCGKTTCPYHRTYENLKGQRFGKLVAMYPTTMKDGTHMYWVCQCDCGNQKEVASNHLKSGNVQSCGCIKASIGEMNIKKLLEKNHIQYKEQVSFEDLKKVKYLRYDFGIYQDNQLIRLIEFDGIQHFEKQNYFTHSLEETKENDILKNEYAIKNKIPLVRIPYWERDNITLDMLFGEEYLVK